MALYGSTADPSTAIDATGNMIDRPKEKTGPTPQLTIRIPDDVRAKLEWIAAEHDRSLAYVLLQAARLYIEHNKGRSRK